MIVSGGQARLLQAQSAYLATCLWGLYTNAWPDDVPLTVLANLTEAAWAGYSRVANGANDPAFLNIQEGYMFPVANPLFLNTSGVTQNFVGCFLTDPTGANLIFYKSLTNSQILIPSPGRYQLAPALVLVGT
jgi:hypothetical protein